MRYAAILFLSVILFSCKDDGEAPKTPEVLQMLTLTAGPVTLNPSDASKNIIPASESFVATFSSAIDTTTVRNAFSVNGEGAPVKLSFSYSTDLKIITAKPATTLAYNSEYNLEIGKTLQGINGSVFPGISVGFKTAIGTLSIASFTIDAVSANTTTPLQNVSLNPVIEIKFSSPINASNIDDVILMSNPKGKVPLSIQVVDNTTIAVTPTTPLQGTARHSIIVLSSLKGGQDEVFAGINKRFYTADDPNPVFPVISDDELLTLVQQQTFKYFYDFGHPVSGMARERNTSGDVVTSGGSGFGLMALVVGIDRNFISRTDGISRFNKIVTFLEDADRFHGAWPHWINGTTGNVIPFSQKDNGGDLVETSFLVQGLLTVRQYLQPGDTVGNNLINRITKMYNEVEWDWYRKDNENVLYWHWSPNYNWDMNFPMYGYFEEQITYILAAASPTHGIPKEVYTNGYGKNGAIVKNQAYYDITLPLESPAPLFWVQYSYLGMDPHFSDDYADYWEQNVNATLINRAYCIDNPKNFASYSDKCWGLTASDNQEGYNAHSPGNDLGVITPTAALSSFPYTPQESMDALKFFYYNLGDRIWGDYGFTDAFNVTESWYADSYLAIDQGPIVVMIENYRTGLLWDLFMSAPEVQQAKDVLDLH